MKLPKALDKFVARRRMAAEERAAQKRARRAGDLASGHQTRLRYTPLGPREMPVNLNGAWSGGSRYQSAAIEDGRSASLGGSGDAFLRYSLDDMRARSQGLDRDNPIYTAITTRVLDVILGVEGITLQAQTADDKLNERLEALWAAEMESPEIRGLVDGVALQRLWLRHLLVDGDVGAIKDEKSGKLQLIEGERIATNATSNGDNRIELGVELDREGRALRFFVAPYDDWGTLRLAEAKPIAAGDFLFMATRNRISQTRGAPIQQPNFAMYDRLSDVCDSEAIAWQLLSRIVLKVTRSEGSEAGFHGSTADSKADPEDLAKRYQAIHPALVFWGKQNEDIAGIAHNVPGANFTDSVKMFMRLLGLPLGFSLEFVLLIWSDTTFSSGRASQKLVERCVKPLGRLLARGGLRPTYCWHVRRWLERGLVPKRADLFAHDWFATPMPFLDPKAEGTGVKLRLEAGLTTPSWELKASDGKDLRDLIQQQKVDLRLMLTAARELNKEFPEAGLTIADFTSFVERRANKRFAGVQDGEAKGEERIANGELEPPPAGADEDEEGDDE